MADKTEDHEITVRDKGKGDRGEYVLKVCIVGEPAVGKTSLLRKYVKNTFEIQHIKTVGVDISKQPLTLEIEGKTVEITLMFWDLAGQIQFHLLHKVYLNGAHGIIIAFDLTRPKTLENAEAWYKRVGQYGYDKVPMVLAGNKADLKDERQVSQEDIQKQMKNLGITDYTETSALEGTAINELFELIARKMLKGKVNP